MCPDPLLFMQSQWGLKCHTVQHTMTHYLDSTEHHCVWHTHKHSTACTRSQSRRIDFYDWKMGLGYFHVQYQHFATSASAPLPPCSVDHRQCCRIFLIRTRRNRFHFLQSLPAHNSHICLSHLSHQVIMVCDALHGRAYRCAGRRLEDEAPGFGKRPEIIQTARAQHVRQ